MHPLVKILLLMAAIEIVRTAYDAAHVHVLHGGSRWWYAAKMAPLVIMTAALAILVLHLIGAVHVF